jgi:hypothetical protein
MNGQTGILMDVHSVLQGSTEVSQPQLPRPGPSGQPTERSQLATPSPAIATSGASRMLWTSASAVHSGGIASARSQPSFTCFASGGAFRRRRLRAPAFGRISTRASAAFSPGSHSRRRSPRHAPSPFQTSRAGCGLHPVNQASRPQAAGTRRVCAQPRAAAKGRHWGTDCLSQNQL